MEAAAGILQPDGTAFLDGQTVVQHLFSQATADNIAVIRAFGHGATGNFVLQPSPGKIALALLCCICHVLSSVPATERYCELLLHMNMHLQL